MLLGGGVSATINFNCERYVWLCDSTCTDVFRYPCSLPYIPHLIVKGVAVSAAIVLVIVTRVSSLIRESRGTHAVYIFSVQCSAW